MVVVKKRSHDPALVSTKQGQYCSRPEAHLCLAGIAAADAGADTSYSDGAGRNLLQHACMTGDWDWVAWALQAGCPLPPGGIKSLVDALQQTGMEGRKVR
jgi:hypothetical protein